MPLPIEAQTRVDQLRDVLAQLSAGHTSRARTKSDAALFIKHADGSVYDAKGSELRGPLPKSLLKGK